MDGRAAVRAAAACRRPGLGRRGPRPEHPRRARGARARASDAGEPTPRSPGSSSPTGSTGPWSSARPGCAARSGAGPNRMNRVVVIRAAAGLAAYLQASTARGTRVGRRVRRPAQLRRVRPRHRRGDGRGRAARAVLPRPLPTPVLAFAIRQLGRAAGVMVTASHNPPQDNGYKVYLGDGSQIVPPGGRGDRRARSTPSGRWPTCRARDGWETLGDERRRRLPRRRRRGRRRRTARATSRVVLHPAARRRRRDRGRRRFERAGFAAPHVVAAAGRAGPGLPDRRVPQPRGAGRRWTWRWRWPRARRRPGRRQRPGRRPVRGRRARRPAGWRMLRGDEVGALLGAHTCSRAGAPATRLRLLDRVLARCSRGWPRRAGRRSRRP